MKMVEEELEKKRDTLSAESVEYIECVLVESKLKLERMRQNVEQN